ncbi:MAG TPA: DUF1295 domain-containing protein [Pedococcus sp.]|nr:DUF1295 domain-containing protein [Pedococcus sp.]
MTAAADSRRPVGRTASLARVAAVYAAATFVGLTWLVVGPDTGRLWLDTLLADVLATLVVFVGSRVLHNSSVYDAYWSVAPPLLVLWWWSHGGAEADWTRSVVVVGVVMLWAVRLTANWVQGWPGLQHEDWRYARLRARTRSDLAVDLFAIHLVPTLQVFLAMLPAYVAVTRGGGRGFGWLDAVALGLGVAAVALELVADAQMRRFVRTREPGQVMERGVWAWCRHPNYLGELTFWWALALFGLAASPTDWWWLFAGAAAMLAMFLGASIPMMDQRSLERRPTYSEVMERVPALIPRPPRGPRGPS